MRLFVAVNLPDAEKARLGAVLEQLRATTLPFRWVEADSLHITLKFLGNVADERCAQIADALERVARGVASFDVEIGGFGAFPSRARPRVIWIGVNGPPALYELHERVDKELEPLGFAREERPFRPHLTLGPIKNKARINSAELDRTTSSIVYNAVIGVESIDLMRSHLSPRGAKYERIARNGLSN
ncbi:MAG: RNA 2',3'-cyclic phosphodiesterase [Gemmatimonadota bacterium]